MNKKVIGALLVSMAANVVLAADASATKATDDKGAYVCQNDSCKGKADCMGFGNDSCKGHNECKGHGIVKATSEKACVKKHGAWVAKK